MLQNQIFSLHKAGCGILYQSTWESSTGRAGGRQAAARHSRRKKGHHTLPVTQDLFSVGLFPTGSLSVYQQALSTLPWSCILNPCVSARLSRWRKGKESACRYRRHTDAGSIPRWGRCPGGGNGNPPSTLAWRIPWTEEPGGLQSLRSQRVRHDWTGTGPLPPVCHHSRPDSNHMLLSNATDAQLGSLSLPMAPSSVFFIWWLKI